MLRSLAVLGLSAIGLSACATMPASPPTEVVRYHLGAPIARGSIVVEPLAGVAPASLEFASYAAAVEAELLRVGYTRAAPGGRADFVATVDFRRSTVQGPSRRSPVSIGLGGGGYSGGYRGGGVGLGGGVSFPLGKRRSNELLATEIRVLIRRRADQQQVWDGSARTAADIRAADATANGQARKLASALFTGFPGESGRTVEVR